MRRMFFVLFILAGIVFFLPNIASGKWAKKQIVSLLEKKLGGRVSIENISLSWTDKQQCSHFQWVDKRNNIALTADSLVISDHLVNCIRFKEKPLQVIVEGATMACEPKGKFLKKKKYKHLQLKCSPIEATIQNGTIAFNKIDIDVTDSLKIATWGTINLEKHHMDITLGLPPKALHKIFGVKDLPEDYLLEVPISCKMSSKALEKKLLSFFLKNYATVTSLQR